MGQLVGGCLGFALSKLFLNDVSSVALQPQLMAGAATAGARFSSTQVLCAEMWGTFLFTLTILCICNDAASSDKNYVTIDRIKHFGIITALYVSIMTCGFISGGGFNPAVATGLNLMNMLLCKGKNLKYLWIYWVGDLLGGIIAGVFYGFVKSTNYHDLKEAIEEEIESEANSLANDVQHA